VYRSLAIRVLLTGLFIALLFGTIAFATQYKKISQNVLEDASNRLALMLHFTRQMAADQGIEPQSAFRQLLSEGLPVRLKHPQGAFVYCFFYNAAGEERGEFIAPGDALAAQARDLVRKGPRRFPQSQAAWHQIVRLAGRPHIQFVTAITTEDKGVIGYVDALFAVSPDTQMALRRNAIKTVLYVALIILATTAMLYPVILHLTRRLARYSETLLASNLETLAVLGSAIAKRDSDTDAHNYRVTIYSVRMAEELGLEQGEIQRLIKGAFLHDIGKIGIRDEILLKPGRLDRDEFSVMQTHVKHGSDIVHRSKWLEEATDVVCGHHEKFGGGGYPEGIKADAIPLAARIFALADVFDALTSQRPYKKPLSFDETMQALEQGRGVHFDPQLLDCFASLAPALYKAFGGTEGEPLQKALAEILTKYFSAGIETLSY